MIEALVNLRGVHQAFDAAEGLLEETLGVPICVSHCGKCCEHRTPTSSVIEAINLLSVYEFQTAKMKLIQQAAEGWLLEKHNGLTIYNGIPTGPQDGKMMAEVNTTAGQQCPFLTETKECLVYSDRPINCRAYGVTHDGVELCDRPLGKGETPLHRGVVQSSPIKAEVDRYFSALKRRQAEWNIRGFFPTLVMRAASPKRLRELADNHQIASAKLMGQDFDSTLIWQPDLDLFRKGVHPDVILAMREIDGIPA